jgi:hypothetical protein
LQGSRGGNAVEKIDADPERGCEDINAAEMYNQMQWPNGAEEPSIETLHEALNIDKSLVWEQLANDFNAVNDIAVHESVTDKSEEADDNEGMRVGELERLLTVGQEMSTDKLERVIAGVERMHSLCINALCFFSDLLITPKKRKMFQHPPPPKQYHLGYHSEKMHKAAGIPRWIWAVTPKNLAGL